MKWYKHDSNANQDAKLKKLRLKYGMEGYGLYWYCLELIAQNVERHNLSFELEHDAEIIAHDTGIHVDLVQDMMLMMVKIGLFENSGGVITCLKMAKRTDEYTQKVIKESGLLPMLSGECPDTVPTKSELTEQNRREQIYKNITDLYHEILPDLPKVVKLSDKRKKYLKARWEGSTEAQSLEWWRGFFEKVRASDFLMCRNNDNGFRADFEWLITEGNFYKVLEGRYDNRS